jgi:hypothetical protein
MNPFWKSLTTNYIVKRKAEMLKSEVYREYYSTFHGLELQPGVNLPYMRTTTENGILYYAEFLMLLHIRGELDGLDRARFYKLVRDLQVCPGLYDRGAKESTNVPYDIRRSISHDNIDAICAGSVICDYTFQDDVVSYGASNLGIFNNVKPRRVMPINPGNYSPWLAMAGKKIWALHWLPCMLINMFIGSFKPKQDTSSRKLYLLELYAISSKRQNFVFNFIAKRYFNSLKKKYGEYFINQIYSIYYPASHPLVEFSRGIKYVGGKFQYEG